MSKPVNRKCCVSGAEMALLVGLLATGCGASPSGMGNAIDRAPRSAAQVDRHAQLVKEADAAWALRTSRAQLMVAIGKWQDAIRIRDDDYDSAGRLARALFLLADGWVQLEGNRAVQVRLHERGFRVALRGLAAVSPEFEKRVLAGATLERAVNVVGRNAVPLVYWYARHLDRWAQLQGFATRIGHSDRVFALVTRVHELDRQFYYGAADRYLGSLYARASSFGRGDLQKSHRHFRASLAVAPDFLGTYVLAARHYARKSRHPSARKRLLKMVIDARPCAEGVPSPCIRPDLVAESVIEQKKARALLAGRR